MVVLVSNTVSSIELLFIRTLFEEKLIFPLDKVLIQITLQP